MKQLTVFLILAAGLGLAACDNQPAEPQQAGADSVMPPPAEATSEADAAAPAAESDAGGAIDAALAGDHRSADHRARDQYRHPKETLLFFGLEPDMTVVELYPGGGWYTEVLAPVLREQGQLIVAQFPATAPPDYRPGTIERYTEMLKGPEYAGTEMVTLTDAGMLEGVADASVDMVLTFRNVHNWINAGIFEEVAAEVARVLKPGGVFGVTDHRANPGADAVASAKRGYVPEAFVVETVEAAGLVFEERSDINANPKDTKDYERGVWELPPSLRGDEANRDKMLEIGESDRMTLRFVKPADR